MNYKNPTKIYFFIEEDVVYDDNIAYLAEGLKKLGHIFFGSRNFWYDASEKGPLIKRADINSQKWDIIFFTHTALRLDFIDKNGRYNVREKKQDTAFLKEKSKKLVFINSIDGVSYLQEDNPDVDIIFRSHYNKRLKHSCKTVPYVLGGYQERLNTTKLFEFNAKKSSCLDTFGFTHPYDHQQRKVFRTKVQPLLKKNGISVQQKQIGSLTNPPKEEISKKWWELTGGKHNPEYYQEITNHFAHACFCGSEIGGFPTKPHIYFVGGKKAEIKKRLFKTLSRTFGFRKRLVQWDSWRFWETLAMKSVPLMFDLEKYGVQMPVMPKNFEHYIGLDPEALESSIQRLKTVWPELPNIAKDSFEWLKTNYSSEKNADRVLKKILEK